MAIKRVVAYRCLGYPNLKKEDRSIHHLARGDRQDLGIRPFDHIIIGKNGHFSFADEGLL